MKDSEFKEKSAVLFMKYLRFIIAPDQGPSATYSVSLGLFPFASHLLSTQEIRDIMCKCEYFKTFLQVMKDYLRLYESNDDLNVEFSEFWQKFRCFLTGDALKWLLLEHDGLVELLQQLTIIACRKYPTRIRIDMPFIEVDVQYICNILSTQAMIISLFAFAASSLEKLDEESKNKIWFKFLPIYKEELERSLQEYPSDRWLSPTLERVLSYILRGPDYDLNNVLIDKNMEKLFSVKKDLVITQVLQNILGALSATLFLGYINPESRYLLVCYNQHFFEDWCPVLFSEDIITIQMLLSRVTEDPF